MFLLRALLRRKLRNFLTLVGISIGISLFISFSSISNNIRGEIQDIIKRYQIDIVVQPKATDTLIAARIPFEDYSKLSKISGITEASPLVVGTVIAPWKRSFLIFGIPNIESFSSKFGMVDGRILKPGANEIMLGSIAAKELGYKHNNKIYITDSDSFTISGIYFFGNRLFDGAAILDLHDAQRILKRDKAINMVFIKTGKSEDIDSIISFINNNFKGLVALRSETLTSHTHILETIDIFVMYISVISAFSCVIIIMNTLFVSVAERTKEIGILRAIGWSRFMIFKNIIAEGLIISILGWFVGCIISISILSLLSSQNPGVLGMIPGGITVNTAIASLSISVFLGFISSVLPAFLASRLLPADALRYE